MKTFTGLFIILFIIGITACGKKSDEQQAIENTMDIAKNAPEMVKKMETVQEKAQKIWKERKERGDTLAINFRELQKYLPTEIPGYTAEKPEGETMNMMGISYSEASIKFVKKTEDGNQERIKITILDYNSATSIFFTAAAWMATNYSVENSDGYSKTFDPGIEDCYGFEEYKIKQKTASITVAVGYRFIITIEANNQSGTDKLKEMLKLIDLKKLVKTA